LYYTVYICKFLLNLIEILDEHECDIINILQIQGQSKPNPNAKQIHIAYHNGDHYSSVRKVNDNVESPASIRLQVSRASILHS